MAKKNVETSEAQNRGPLAGGRILSSFCEIYCPGKHDG